MSEAIITRRGGISSGGGLDLKVIGGTTQPSNPTENTIWVNTDTPINGYAFSATNPSSLFHDEIYTAEGATAGAYINSSGTEVTSSTLLLVTAKISLPQGTKSITINEGSESTSAVCHGFYDSSGNLISTVLRKTGKTEYIVPNGTASVRVSILKSGTESIIANWNYSPEGFVWFNVGTESYTPIDVDKENTIMLYPTGCSQYINGVWIDKEFKTYSNDDWETGFWTHAYNKGDICEGLTGGWETVGMGDNGNFNKPVAPTVTYNDTSMTIVQGDSSYYQCGLVRAINQIDLTPYSQISIVIDSVSKTHDGATANLRIHDSFGNVATTGVVANVTCKTIGTHTLDVSSINRPVYMAILAYWGITFNVTEIRLEV